MNIPLFIGLILFLGIASLLLGRSPKNKDKSTEDYFLMGRKLGLFSLIMTLLATQIGGGALLGASEEAYLHGWRVLFYPLGMVLGFIVLGSGYGAKIRKLNLTTIPEIFETIYKSIFLRKTASIISIIALFIILVGQAIAARKFFVSLNFHGNLMFVLFWAVLITYTVMGGLRAVVKTDILQTLFILIAFSITMVAAVFGSTPNSPAMTQALPQSTNAPWLTWLLMPLFFMLIEQDMGQRCFAAKNPKTVSIAAISSAVLLFIVSLVPIFLGTMASRLGLEINPGSSVLITAVQTLTNPIVSTILICAILMAVVSTADSLLCSVSSNIICDFPLLGKKTFTSRAITLLIGVSTFALAFAFSNVVVILMFAYQLAVSTLFVPVTMAVWTKHPTKRSALVSMIVGGFSFAILHIWTLSVPRELIALGFSFITFTLSEFSAKRTSSFQKS